MTFRRRFLQFSLRTMVLLMMLVAGIAGGVHLYQDREHRRLCKEFIGRTEQEIRSYREMFDGDERENELDRIEWRVRKSVESLRKEEWERLESLVMREKNGAEIRKQHKLEMEEMRVVNRANRAIFMTSLPRDPPTSCGEPEFEMFTHPRWGDQ